MKKLLIILSILVILICIAIFLYNRYMEEPSYKGVELHSKLIKEIIIDCRDSMEYKRDGLYKKVYRKYNYYYNDSTEGSVLLDQEHLMRFYTTSVGDTVYKEYIDFTNYPRREE